MAEHFDMVNEIIKESYKPHPSFKHASEYRDILRRCARFVLDYEMSRFLGQTSYSTYDQMANEKRPAALDSVRHIAKLPFPEMFVQFDNWAHRDGIPDDALDVRGRILPKANDDLIRHIGVLCRDTTIKVGDDILSVIELREFVEHEGCVAEMPFTWCYSVSDVDLSQDSRYDIYAGVFGHGLSGYVCPACAVQYDSGKSPDEVPQRLRVPFFVVPDEQRFTTPLVVEAGGMMRHIMTFIATLNAVPTVRRIVEPRGRMYVRGTFRPKLSHSVVSLNLPSNVDRYAAFAKVFKEARTVKHHDVRAHWRTYRKGAPECAHEWGEPDNTGHVACKRCHAQRVWVVLPNGRGTRDNTPPREYRVSHKSRTGA